MTRLYTTDELRALANDKGPFFADNARQALKWAAQVLEAADEAVAAAQFDKALPPIHPATSPPTEREAQVVLLRNIAADLNNGRQVWITAALITSVADRLESDAGWEQVARAQDGPQMVRGMRDGAPVMGTMRQVMQDYQLAADAEAAEVDRLRTELTRLKQQEPGDVALYVREES